MKSFKELISDDSPKNIGKLTKGFEKGNSSQRMTAFLAEGRSASSVEFDKICIMVTENYICDFSAHRGGLMRGPIVVVPVSAVTNIYKSNIFPNAKGESQYDFDFYALAIELTNGNRIFTGKIGNKTRNVMPQLEEAVKLVKSKINPDGGAACI